MKSYHCHIVTEETCATQTKCSHKFCSRIQFPLIEGLEYVLLQGSSKLKKVAYGIQILQSRDNHWITVSTIDTCEGEVNVYDSLSSVDDGNCFCDYIKIKVIVPQKETNLCDCVFLPLQMQQLLLLVPTLLLLNSTL